MMSAQVRDRLPAEEERTEIGMRDERDPLVPRREALLPHARARRCWNYSRSSNLPRALRRFMDNRLRR